MKKTKAFTISEVLLTLAIVGVITSVTIPSLMAQNHAKKYQTMTKKAMYTLQSAVDAKYEVSTKKMNDFSSFFAWLANEGPDPDNKPEDAIRLSKSTGSNAQTADGVIFRTFDIYYDSDYKHHGAASFTVDINGTEPPTQKAFDEALSSDEREHNEDIIFLEMDRYGTIKPITNGANSNAIQYFDI